jgi:hypothetical protein
MDVCILNQAGAILVHRNMKAVVYRTTADNYLVEVRRAFATKRIQRR